MIILKIKDIIKSNVKLYSFVNFLYFKPYYLFMLAKKFFLNAIDKRADNKKRMVNLGAGFYFRRHWKNLDFPSSHYHYQSILIDYKFNLMSYTPFPFSNNQISLFFSSHTLEHIPQKYCQHIFNEIYRCLKPKRAFRITVPDFDIFYKAFSNNDKAFFLNHYKGTIEKMFLNSFASYMADKVKGEDLRKNFINMDKEQFADFYTKKIPLISQKKNSGNHINWWNYDKLYRMLKKAGFNKIYLSKEQKSFFHEMRGKGRYTGFDSTHPEISIFVEAIK